MTTNFKRELKAEVRRYGISPEDLEEALAFIDMEAVTEAMVGMATHIRTSVREKIESQPFWWEPLNEKYLAMKKRKGLDERTLIATGDYLGAIDIWDTEITEDSVRMRVGLPRRNHMTSEDVELNRLGRWLEYGTTKMPARPHWGPAFREWRRAQKPYMEKLAKLIVQSVESRLDKASVSDKSPKLVKPEKKKRKQKKAPKSKRRRRLKARKAKKTK